MLDLSLLELSLYEAYLEEHAKYDELRGFTLELSLQFTNEHAAVPANGLRARLTFPGKEQGILITHPDDFPDEPKAPSRPSVPKPTNLFAGIDPSLYTSRFPRINPNIADFRPRGNISGPEITEGSQVLTYEIDELLHDMKETPDENVLMTFGRSGSWQVPFTLHARNLPNPRSGVIEIVATGPPAPA
jgi:hypothetical protein